MGPFKPESFVMWVRDLPVRPGRRRWRGITRWGREGIARANPIPLWAHHCLANALNANTYVVSGKGSPRYYEAIRDVLPCALVVKLQLFDYMPISAEDLGEFIVYVGAEKWDISPAAVNLEVHACCCSICLLISRRVANKHRRK